MVSLHLVELGEIFEGVALLKGVCDRQQSFQKPVSCSVSSLYVLFAHKGAISQLLLQHDACLLAAVFLTMTVTNLISETVSPQ